VSKSCFRAPGIFGRAEFWTGLRPATPVERSLCRAHGLPQSVLNTGHGTLGWTLGAGSGFAWRDDRSQ